MGRTSLSGQWRGPDPLLTSDRMSLYFSTERRFTNLDPDRLICHVAVPRHLVPPLLQSQKKEGHSSVPAATAALHRTATHQEQWAGQQCATLAAGGRPVSICTHLATWAQGWFSKGAGRRLGTHQQERQDKHRDPGRTDRAAAAQTPASLWAGASGSPQLLPSDVIWNTIDDCSGYPDAEILYYNLRIDYKDTWGGKKNNSIYSPF